MRENVNVDQSYVTAGKAGVMGKDGDETEEVAGQVTSSVTDLKSRPQLLTPASTRDASSSATPSCITHR
jgi:hypothetical protein